MIEPPFLSSLLSPHVDLSCSSSSCSSISSSPSLLISRPSSFLSSLRSHFYSQPSDIDRLVRHLSSSLNALRPFLAPISSSPFPNLLTLLLSVEEVQTSLESPLLDLLVAEGGVWHLSPANVSALRSLLQSLAALPRRSNVDHFIEKICGSFEELPKEVCCEVVSLLPQLIPTGSHDSLAHRLMDVMRQPKVWHDPAASHIVMPILDALSSLDVPRSMWKESVQVLLRHADDWALMEMPAMIKCLSCAVDTDEEHNAKIAEAIRMKIPLVVIPPAIISHNSSLSVARFSLEKQEQDAETMAQMIAHQLKIAFEQQKALLNAVRTQIACACQIQEHDFALLLLMYLSQVPQTAGAKRLLQLIVSLSLENKLQMNVVEHCMLSYGNAFVDFTSSLLSLIYQLSQHKLKAHEQDRLMLLVHTIYFSLFESLSEPLYVKEAALAVRKRLVMQFVEHAMNKENVFERKMGLWTLRRVQSLLNPFEMEVHNLMTNIDGFTLWEARIVSELNARLCIYEEENTQCDPSHVFSQRSRASRPVPLAVNPIYFVPVQKWLSSNAFYRHLGLVFMAAAINRTYSLYKQAGTLHITARNHLMDWWQLLARSFAGQEERAFFNDELSGHMQRHPSHYHINHDLLLQTQVHQLRSPPMLVADQHFPSSICAQGIELQLIRSFTSSDKAEYRPGYVLDLARVLLSDQADVLLQCRSLLRLACVSVFTQPATVESNTQTSPLALAYTPLILFSEPENEHRFWINDLPRSLQLAFVSAYAHAISWLRELVSQFACWPGAQTTIVIRCQELVRIEKELLQLCKEVDVQVTQLHGFGSKTSASYTKMLERLYLGVSDDEKAVRSYTKLRKSLPRITKVPVKSTISHREADESDEESSTDVDEPEHLSDEEQEEEEKPVGKISKIKSKAKTATLSLQHKRHAAIDALLQPPSLNMLRILPGHLSRMVLDAALLKQAKCASGSALHANSPDSASITMDFSPSPGARALSLQVVVYLAHSVLLPHVRASLQIETGLSLLPTAAATGVHSSIASMRILELPQEVQGVLKYNENQGDELELDHINEDFIYRTHTEAAASMLRSFHKELRAFGIAWVAVNHFQKHKDGNAQDEKEEDTEVSVPDDWHDPSINGEDLRRSFLKEMMELVNLLIRQGVEKTCASGEVAIFEAALQAVTNPFHVMDHQSASFASISIWQSTFDLLHQTIYSLESTESLNSALHLLSTCAEWGNLSAHGRHKISGLAHKILQGPFTPTTPSRVVTSIVQLCVRFHEQPLKTLEKLVTKTCSLVQEDDEEEIHIQDFSDFFTPKRASWLIKPELTESLNVMMSFAKKVIDTYKRADDPKPMTTLHLTPQNIQYDWPMDGNSLKEQWMTLTHSFELLVHIGSVQVNKTLHYTMVVLSIKFLKICCMIAPLVCRVKICKSNSPSIASLEIKTMTKSIQSATKTLNSMFLKESKQIDSSLIKIQAPFKKAQQLWVNTVIDMAHVYKRSAQLCVDPLQSSRERGPLKTLSTNPLSAGQHNQAAKQGKRRSRHREEECQAETEESGSEKDVEVPRKKESKKRIKRHVVG